MDANGERRKRKQSEHVHHVYHAWTIPWMKTNLAPDCQKMQKACVQSSRKGEGNEHQQANEKLWNVMTVSDLAVKVTANVP